LALLETSPSPAWEPFVVVGCLRALTDHREATDDCE
jgi:hypothetical protein